MLTGAALILFMWSHMILVASVNLGAGVMNALAHFLEATYMAQVGGPIIACIFLFHFILAARKVPFRAEQQSTIWKLSRQLRHTDTYLWLVQAITAMIILIMGSIECCTHSGRILVCLLSDSAAHDRTPCGNRFLSNCCEVGFCQTEGQKEIQEV
jgi:fumarate reductase subunit C